MTREKKETHLKMTLTIADDQTTSGFQDGDSMGSRLRKLDALAGAFRSFDEQSKLLQNERDEPLFEWGHLLVMEHIGQGSFGDVYRAFDPTLQCAVALKLWSKDRCGYVDENLAIEEARRLARVRHPNVLAVHGAAIHGGQAGFWADLLYGETLHELYKDDPIVELNEVLEIGVSVAGALNAVHQAGLIHGDVKPANVMKEKKGRVVLMDFSAGRDLQKGDGSLSPGTPATMAPEVFFGGIPNAQSDLYSLGVLLYFLLTGTYPIKAKRHNGYIAVHRKGFRPNLSRQRAGLPRAMVKMVERLLDPKPQCRPSAREVGENIGWIQQRPQRRVRRLLLAAIACSLLLGSVVSTWNFLQTKRSAGHAELAKNQTAKVNQFLQDMLALPASSLKGRDVKVVEILNKAADDAEMQFADQPEVLSEILYTLGVTYMRIDMMDKGRILLSKCLALREANLGVDHLDTLRSKIRLGDALTRLARYKEAEILLSEVVQVGNSGNASFNKITLRAQTRLAAVIGELRRPQEAIELVREVLEKWEGYQLEASIKYQALQELGAQLDKLGKYQQACEVHRQVASWYLEKLGEDHPRTIGTWANFATSLCQIGDLEEAEVILEALAPRSQEIMGPDHFQTIDILNNWGGLLNRKGKYAEAGDRFKEVYQRCLRVLGPRHPRTLATMGNLANILSLGGYHGEALELQRETFRLQSDVLSREHPDTLLTMINLAEFWVKNGQPDRGLGLACEAHDYLISSFGADHLFAIEAWDIVGTAYADLGFLSEAEAIHRENLAKKHILFANNMPILILSLDRLARVLKRQGSHGELVSLYGEIYDAYQSIYASDHPLTHRARQDLDQSLTQVRPRESILAQ